MRLLHVEQRRKRWQSNATESVANSTTIAPNSYPEVLLVGLNTREAMTGDATLTRSVIPIAVCFPGNSSSHLISLFGLPTKAL
jgi:hypothetical protein